jgi:NAD(P)-dependent dehydrogenase (short-subunit alcohol dehydrogenase family)
MNIKNKIAIVTGSGRKGRLGHSIAIALARKGANILVHYNSSKEGAEEVANEIKGMGVNASICQVDMSDNNAGEKLINTAIKELGSPPQILVNASAPFPQDSVDDFNSDVFTNTMNAITRGPILAIKAMANELSKDKDGVVVNFIDVRIGSRPYSNRISYGTAKAALLEATYMLAVDLSPRIRVNAISPGAALQAAGMSKAHHEKVLEGVPLGREIGSKSIAEAVITFVENDSLVGVNLPVDGGARLI